MKLNTPVSWLDAAQTLLRLGEDHVIVTVLGSRGSTPRDPGSKMVVSRDELFGSIGGGHLEHRSQQLALDMLKGELGEQHIEHFNLGPSLGQCCGGSVSVLFERFCQAVLKPVIFGAGHVGASLVPILAQLPCTIRWIDSREAFTGESLPSNVETIVSEQPELEVAACEPGSAFVILTHNHQQDYAILKAVLSRGDASYIGLIGSQTKWRRFQMRLDHEGVNSDQRSDVHCPIGLSAVPGKLPVEVATAIAAELIAHRHRDKPTRTSQQGISRPELSARASEADTETT